MLNKLLGCCYHSINMGMLYLRKRNLLTSQIRKTSMIEFAVFQAAHSLNPHSRLSVVCWIP